MNMIINPRDFMLDNILYIQKQETGRCYILVEPTGKRSPAARRNLMAYKRISQAHYDKSLEACKQITGGAG